MSITSSRGPEKLPLGSNFELTVFKNRRGINGVNKWMVGTVPDKVRDLHVQRS
jgi:hypothetical protein